MPGARCSVISVSDSDGGMRDMEKIALAGWGKYLDSEIILVYYVRRASTMPFIYVLSTND